jgi:hypothetical protein
LVKKIARIFAIVIVSIILINIILYITLSIPAIQKKAADIAVDKLKPIIGTELTLDGIRIRLFNTVELKGLYVEDLQQDTLLYVERIAVRIHALELLKNRISVQKAGLENFVANVHRATPDDPFNFQFIIDAFATEKDTTVVKESKWRITAHDVILKNGTLRYNILSAPPTPGQFNMNHLGVHNFNFRGEADFINMEDMKADIGLLSFHEMNAGLVLYDLKALAYANGPEIRSDKVSMKLNHTDIEVSDALFNRETKAFNLRAVSELTDPGDIAIFTSRFAHLDKPLSFTVDAEGELPQATLRGLQLQYGSDTRIDATGTISDFKDFNNSKLDINLRNLSVSQHDLQALIRTGAVSYTSPEQLLALGDLDLRLQARGRLSSFRYDGIINTEQGDVMLNGTGRITNQFKQMRFEGPVRVNDVQLANILGEGPGLGNATMYTDAAVSISNSTVTVTADGNIVSAYYRGYHYNDLNFNGTYSGNNVAAHITSDTESNQLDLTADISFGSGMAFDVEGTVARLDLSPFILLTHWKNPYTSFTIDGDLSGSTIDELAGTLVIDNTSLVDSNFIYNPGAIYLQALADTGEGKKLQIMSSFLEAEMIGDYYFSSIGRELMQALHPHLPSVIAEPEGETGGGNNRFQFHILLKNTEDFSHAFGLPFYNVDHATIFGDVNMEGDESVKIDAHIPRVMMGNNDIRETMVELLSATTTGIALDVNSYLVQNNGFINARLHSDAASDKLSNTLFFDLQQANTTSNGELLITMDFLRDDMDQLASDIRIHPTTILFNNKQVVFNDAAITYRKDHITIDNFGLREENMLLLGIEGVASKSEADNIRIYFNNTELANILAAFNISGFAGAINGDIFLRQALESPMVHTEDLRIENITVSNDTIGTLTIEGNWDQLYSGLDLNAYLINKGERNLDIKGYIPLGDKSPLPMDVTFRVDEFNLTAIQPLTAGIFSRLSGEMNANIHITGGLSAPVTNGWLGIDEGEMRVAFTNVTYFVSDTIDINPDNVGLQNLVIRDQDNHTATLNLKLSHSNFGGMVYNAGIEMDDFMLLNNENRTDMMAYGNLKLSGNLNITGSPTGIYGDGFLTSTSKSEVTVVLPQTAKAAEYSGVVYINTPQENDSLSFLRKDNGEKEEPVSRLSSGIPIVMRATVNLTPLLTAGVMLDPTTGNALEVSGEGELNINFNSKSTPPVLIYGDYVISEGKFHYNMQSLRTIDFRIREGSRLTMEGDPLNTQFNITAYLPVKADLAALSSTFSTELANTRVAVNALLEIRGDLEAMDLQYDIELPESSSDIQQRVNSFINNEETKILQFAYLATTGSFIPSEGTPQMNFGSSIFTKFASNTLARGLDALFASALNDNWSISTNLESVDGTLDNVRMGVDVSTRLLNDRLRITTNLSYGDNSMLATQQAFMGEFELEYDINNWFMIRAFNRANERFYRRTPTTQGIGVVVTKEAKSFRELFDFRFIKKREDKE